MLQILQKQLDESTLCPLCQASMYWIEAESYEQEKNFHECSHCTHRVFVDRISTCHCEKCTASRKKMMTETRLQEQRHATYKNKEQPIAELAHLSFLEKLFLLSILNQHVQEHLQHSESIAWERIKYAPITPNYLFQNSLFKKLIKDQVFIEKQKNSDTPEYYINLKIEGYSDPSLFSITQQLRQWFFHQLSLGIPFKHAEEVKDTLYLVLYQEIIQFMQRYCKPWQIQISGNKQFQQLCYRLLEHLAVGQIYFMIQRALEYLHQKNALQARNDQFINTNLLKKTLEQYRERAITERWETSTLPRPSDIPLSQMSQILFEFLGYDETIFFQPVWRSWKKIESRLKFYSTKRCMYCGSEDLTVDYDAEHYVSLLCRQCRHQDHYFTQ